MLPGYLEGLEEAGAIPIILPLAADGADIAQLADLCDGFLFTGGQDVAPQLYGEAMKPTCGELCPARDTLERELLNRALEQDKPILGICRGLQILNVTLGGTLYQDLPTEHPPEISHSMKPPYDRAAHTVRILPDTPLAAQAGAGRQQLPPPGDQDPGARSCRDGTQHRRSHRGGVPARQDLRLGRTVAPGTVLTRW